MTAQYKIIPRKGIYLPNASHLGYDRHMVTAGDVVLYKETHADGSYRTRLGRALSLVTHGHDGGEYRKPTGRGRQTKRAPLLRVLAFNDTLSHAFERWVNVDDVVQCLSAGEAYGQFVRAMLAGPLPSPEACFAASEYGTLSPTYFAHAADEAGNLPEDWRKRVDAHHARASAENDAKRAAREATEKAACSA